MISSVAFHPAGTIVASASTDKSIKLFDIRTHKLIQHYGDAHSGVPTEGLGNAAQGGVNSISFGGPSGEWMISTGMDGLVKVGQPFLFIPRVFPKISNFHRFGI